MPGGFPTRPATQYTAIHHPEGDWKKISFGARQGLHNCIAGGEDSFFCLSEPDGGSFFRYSIDAGFRESGFAEQGQQGGVQR